MRKFNFKILSRKVTQNNYLTIGSDVDHGRRLQDEISNRDGYYSELLKNYKSITKARNCLKEIHKWIFFWAVMIASAVGIIIIGKILYKIISSDDIQLIVDSIPLMITALVSFMSTVIVVPATIAKFLFNTNEDDNITKLIQHTQEHDSTGMQFLKERFLSNTDSYDTPSNETLLYERPSEKSALENEELILNAGIQLDSDSQIDSDN